MLWKKVIRTSIKGDPPTQHRQSIKIYDDAINANITRNFEGDCKFIPKFKIVNSPSCASVVVSLKKGQSVYCNFASMNYCDGTVNIFTRSQGIFRSLIRMFFTTSAFFLNYYPLNAYLLLITDLIRDAI